LEHNVTEVVTRLVFQLAIILLLAKLAGEICVRYIKIPPVLGELSVGILIGPHLLGGMSFGYIPPLFEVHSLTVDVDPVAYIPGELWFLAQVAAIVLLFSTGLETNIKQFLRYVGPASAVAAGGVVIPFLLGVWATVFFGYASGFTSPEALFMGAIMTATSIGITARVLSDLGFLGSSEGVTILGAAVVDDVIGVLILTVVIGMSETGDISLPALGLVSLKAIGFWLCLTGGGIFLAKYISKLLLGFRGTGSVIGLSLCLALLCSGLAEVFGLAMIIGAYSIGLALSGSELAKRIEEPMNGLYHAIVPVFFVVMGMLVDVGAMRDVIAFGFVLSILAIAGKLFGAGLPAMAVGFNAKGGLRIGLGMIPRGEVALIIAGVGLARHVIGMDLFGISIMMTVITTVVAPILLVPAFRKGGSGERAYRGSEDTVVTDLSEPL
jgi:Kef-type K+ transport system membrane component KefB